MIVKYIDKLESTNAHWAGARWYDKMYSLSIDFALFRNEILKQGLQIFNFNEYPECWIANFLMQNNYTYLLMHENMPTNVPGYIKKYFYAPDGRFNIFPKSMMVTYHIEDLKRGMDEKKMYFNLISHSNFFHISNFKMPSFELFKLKSAFLFSNFFPRRSWFKKRYYYKFI